MKSWITQIRKGVLELCVMNLLAHEELYGYALVQQLKSIERLAVTESTVYPILSRLREEGYLQVRVVPSDEGPTRRYFSLTPEGQQRLRTMQSYWNDLNEVMQRLHVAENATEGNK